MSIYEEVEIEDMVYVEEESMYYYPCPCGDKFRITLEELWDGEDIAKCPSCTLRIQVIYEEEDLPPLPEEGDDDVSHSEDGEAEQGDTKDVTTTLSEKLQTVEMESSPENNAAAPNELQSLTDKKTDLGSATTEKDDAFVAKEVRKRGENES
jgi:diphthamide biosynthesis protein 3